MNDTISGKRRRAILDILSKYGALSRTDLGRKLPKKFYASRITIIRDLNALKSRKLITITGKGPSTRYKTSITHPFLKYINMERYFETEADGRDIQYIALEPDVFSEIPSVFTKDDIAIFRKWNARFPALLKTKNTSAFKRELERFVIELSWKSSRIEGNTYSLLETERLITQQDEADGHAHEEAVMILNHKKTFDKIMSRPSSYKLLTLHNLRSLHSLLTSELNVDQGLRKIPVGITGTLFKPPDNQWQILDALEEMIKIINNEKNALTKAFTTLVGVSAIQPFADANKRTSRMVSNAILLAHKCFPLSYRNVDEVLYKEALILFLEQHDLAALKNLFLEQCRFASEAYFRK